MTEQHRKNLIRLRDFLYELQSRIAQPQAVISFDMGMFDRMDQWVEVDAEDEGISLQTLVETREHPLRPPCGSACCALGWAATLWDLTEEEFEAIVPWGTNPDTTREYAYVPGYQKFCARIFGIKTIGNVFDFLFEGEYATAGDIHDPDNPASPTQAAARIQHFLNNGVPDGDFWSWIDMDFPVDWI